MLKKKILFSLFFLLFFLWGCENHNARKNFNSAVQFWDNQQYEEALQNFIAVARTFPKHSLADDALYWIATTYHFYLNRPAQAIVYYKSLIQQYPRSEFAINSNFYIAKIYEQSSNSSYIENAIYIYQDLLNSEEINSEQIKKTYFAIVNNYLKVEQYQNARIILKKMYNKYSNDDIILGDIYFLVASSYEKENKLRFAEITYREALKKVRNRQIRKKNMLRIASLLEIRDKFQDAINIYKSLYVDADDKEKQEYQFKITSLNNQLKATR